MGVGEVQAGGGDIVELLARSGRRLGDVHDLQDLGAAEAGDLHGTRAGEVMACSAMNLTGAVLGRSWFLRAGRMPW